jgi:hypothetical protein
MRLLAALVLAIHLAWIVLVIFGTLWTRGRPWWTGFHIAALVWGILAEVGPWPCPLTVAEQMLQSRAGLPSYTGDCLVHYLDAIVYPHLPAALIVACAVSVCALNLVIYAWRLARALRRRQTS